VPPRVTIGGDACKQKYSASILNISAMSFGSLSAAAVSALNRGAKQGNFYHNTGEGGISPYLSLPKTPSMNSFLFYISENLSCASVLMVKTTDMRNCHDLSLFWRFN
jgi:hypothetical protein